jgi:cytoskeletal protein RodZ
MKNQKMLLVIPLIAIAVIAVGFGVTTNVFAQVTTSTTPTTVDPQDSPNEVQTTDNGADNQKDGETNDDHTSATEGPNGDGDGEQKDSTESGK